MPTLDWLNREAAFQTAAQVPTRILRPHAAGHVMGDPAGAGNLLIQGDNLEALKALLPFYRGQVKCIFIDPPYNTKSAFEHYDDNLEHSQWLSMMLPRLQILRELLNEDGSIWVTIDDNEGHYLKVMMDEVFGRRRFVASCVWQKRYSRENREAIGDVHDYIHVYASNPERFKASRNLVPMTEDQAKVYRNPNKDPLGRWRPVPMTAQAGHATPEQFYEVISPSGKVFTPSDGRCWGIAMATYERLFQRRPHPFRQERRLTTKHHSSCLPGAAPTVQRRGIGPGRRADQQQAYDSTSLCFVHVNVEFAMIKPDELSIRCR